MVRNDNYYFYMNDALLEMQILRDAATRIYTLNIWKCGRTENALFNKLNSLSAILRMEIFGRQGWIKSSAEKSVDIVARLA